MSLRAILKLDLTAERKWKHFLRSIFLGLGYFSLAGMAYAATDDVGGGPASFTLFDPIQDKTDQISAGWQATIGGLIRNTFLLLAVIEMCWAASKWVFEKDSMEGFAVELIKKIMFIGFGYTLLLHAPEWIPQIINSFKEAGLKATGNPMPLTADNIMATGFAVVKLIWRDIPKPVGGILGFIIDGIASIPGIGLPAIIYKASVYVSKLHVIIVAAFASLIVVIAYAIIAFQLLCINIEMDILLAAGIILLGLSSSSWTKQYTDKYTGYAMTAGMRFLVLILILGLSQGLIHQFQSQYSFDVLPILKLAGVCLIQAILALRAPEMAMSLATGQGTGMSMGGVVQATQSLVNSTKAVVGMVTAPAHAAASAVSSGTKSAGGSAGAKAAAAKVK